LPLIINGFHLLLAAQRDMDCNMALSNDDPPFQKRTGLIERNINQAWTNPYGPSPHRLVIGQREQIEADIDRERTAHMRDVRARPKAAEEKALCMAIVAARGDGPAEKPWREANVILDQVNRLLNSNGYASVGIDVVYRRLKDSRVLKERVNTL
jgi:hypothetical protein